MKVSKETLKKVQNNLRCRDYEERADFYKANQNKSIALIIASMAATTLYLVGLVKFVNADFDKEDK